MAEIDYYKLPTLPPSLPAFHALAEIWVLENGLESVFLFSPNDTVIIGRDVPADLFNQDSGVEFCRVFITQGCSTFVPSSSIVLTISARLENETVFTNRLTALFRAAFGSLRIDVRIEKQLIQFGRKIVGVINYPYESDGLFLGGVIIYLGYDTALAKNALHAQNIPFDKCAGLNELGVAVTKTQIAEAIEKEFSRSVGMDLTARPFAVIQPELEALNDKRVVDQWIEGGVY